MSIKMREKVLMEDAFPSVGHATAEGYIGFEVILFPIGGGKQRILFYALSEFDAALRCTEAYGNLGLSYRLYRLTLLSVNGRIE